MTTLTSLSVRTGTVLLALLLLTGCAHRLQFRVVDSVSGQPLPGVAAKVRKVTSFSYFERQPHEHEVGVTGTNGLITVSGVSKKDSIYFSTPRLRGAVAGYVGSAKIAVLPYPPHKVDTACKEQTLVECASGVYTVPLQPW